MQSNLSISNSFNQKLASFSRFKETNLFSPIIIIESGDVAFFHSNVEGHQCNMRSGSSLRVEHYSRVYINNVLLYGDVVGDKSLFYTTDFSSFHNTGVFNEVEIRANKTISLGGDVTIKKTTLNSEKIFLND